MCSELVCARSLGISGIPPAHQRRDVADDRCPAAGGIRKIGCQPIYAFDEALLIDGHQVVQVIQKSNHRAAKLVVKALAV